MSRPHRIRPTLGLIAALLAAGCASTRPTETKAPEAPPAANAAPADSVPADLSRPEQPRSAARPSRFAADTLAARAAIRRCAGRKLLPDQESSYNAALQLLEQTRDALRQNDRRRAESLARQARQLSASLGCP